MIHGIGYKESLELFEKDPEVSRIILIGEIGGREELDAADYIKSSITKPVFAYIAGHSAPVGVQLGHAGAILSSGAESAEAKTNYLAQAGVRTANSMTALIDAASEQ